MKNLRLLICALLGVASAILSFSASATEYAYFVVSPNTWVTTTGAYCSGQGPISYPGYSYVDTSTMPTYAHCTVKNGPDIVITFGQPQQTINCVDPQVLDPATKSCVTPEPPPDPCKDAAGQTYDYIAPISTKGDMTGAPPPDLFQPGPQCEGQCLATYQGATGCYSRSANAIGGQIIFCQVNFLVTADQCPAGGLPSPPASSDAPPVDPAAPPCPPGTYAVKSGSQWVCNSQDAPHPAPDGEGCPDGTTTGSMNGQTVCVPSSGNGNAAPTGSGTPGAGGANGSGNGSGTGSAGAGGEGAGAQGATADTGGAVGGSADTKGVGQTSVGVECGTAPVCSGDPLLCGIQLQEFESACAVQNVIGSPLPEDELEKWQAVGAEIDSPAVDTALSRVSQKLDSFSSRLSFQTSGCPADFSISVLGRSIPIAISDACPLLQLMKMILFMGAYLFSLRVLWSSVL